MSLRVSEEWTAERCKRGARIKLRTERYDVDGQSEPYETTVHGLCCAACEAEAE